jgi:hypothetical protein
VKRQTKIFGVSLGYFPWYIYIYLYVHKHLCVL